MTMELNEIIGLIPADKQEAVKGELANYAKIDGVQVLKVDDAERIMREHPAFKSKVDSFISKAVASHDERFQAEKLPSLVEAELLKRNPPKDPRDMKLAEMENKMKEMERQSISKEQTAKAIAIAAEKGIPIDIAKRFIGNNDDETNANLDALAGALMPWRDEAVKKSLAERLGNNQAPKAGASPDQLAQMKAEHTRLMYAKEFHKAQLIMEQIRRMEK